jgi:hypothetical protein
MGNEAEIEENLIEQTEQMNEAQAGDIIQPQFSKDAESLPSSSKP